MGNNRGVASLLSVGALGLAFALAGCGEGDTAASAASDPSPTAANLPYTLDRNTGTADVTKSAFGESWPLTVDGGLVSCIKTDGGGVLAIFVSDTSTADHPERYALNGTAKSSGNMEMWDLKSVDPIWADNPAISGTKKDISVLIDVCSPYM